MKKKIMIIGPRGSGKSTLAHALDGRDKPLRRTPDVIYGQDTIDVPAAYLENHWMLRHIIAIAQNHADILVVLADAAKETDVYSPAFVQMFNCPVLGVVTHMDHQGANPEKARNTLLQTGVQPPFVEINATDDSDLATLAEAINALRDRRQGG